MARTHLKWWNLSAVRRHEYLVAGLRETYGRQRSWGQGEENGINRHHSWSFFQLLQYAKWTDKNKSPKIAMKVHMLSLINTRIKETLPTPIFCVERSFRTARVKKNASYNMEAMLWRYHSTCTVIADRYCVRIGHHLHRYHGCTVCWGCSFKHADCHRGNHDYDLNN